MESSATESQFLSLDYLGNQPANHLAVPVVVMMARIRKYAHTSGDASPT